jgi:hypothetical protein
MIEIPTFLRFHWLKILVTYVLVPSFINAIYTLNPTILMWSFLIELCLLVIAVTAMAFTASEHIPVITEMMHFRSLAKELSLQ